MSAPYEGITVSRLITHNKAESYPILCETVKRTFASTRIVQIIISLFIHIEPLFSKKPFLRLVDMSLPICFQKSLISTEFKKYIFTPR